MMAIIVFRSCFLFLLTWNSRVSGQKSKGTDGGTLETTTTLPNSPVIGGHHHHAPLLHLHQDNDPVWWDHHLSDHSDSNSRYDALTRWLWNLTLDLPDQSFKKYLLHLSVTDMSCTHFAIDSVNSTYLPSTSDFTNSSTSNPGLDVRAGGVVAQCNGRYHSTGLAGNVHATVVSPQNNDDGDNDKQAVGFRLDFISNRTSGNSMRLATAIRTLDCDTNLAVPSDKLHFDGSISAKLIDLFKGSIAGYISSALESQLCPILSQTLDDELSSLIQHANQFLIHLIDDDDDDDDDDDIYAEREVVGHNSQRRMQWLQTEDDSTITTALLNFRQDTPVVITILEATNYLMDRYLNKGLAVDIMELLGLMRAEDEQSNGDQDCAYFFHGINGLVRTLTGGKAHIGLSIPSFYFTIPTYAQLELQLQRLEVDGLANFDRVQLLVPEVDDDGATFSSFINTTTGLNITATINLTITAIPGGHFKGEPLEEYFQLHMNTSDFYLDFNTTVAVNRSQFATLSASNVIEAIKGITELEERDQIGCVVEPLISLQLDRIHSSITLAGLSIMEIESLDTSSIGGLFRQRRQRQLRGRLEEDIDTVINHFLTLFITEYDDLMRASLVGFVDGKGHELLNNFSHRWVDNFHQSFPVNKSLCEETSRKVQNTTDFFNFKTIGIFDQFNQFLNETATALAINDYVNCVGNTFNQQIYNISPIFKYANISLSLRQLFLENLGSFESLELLLPESDGYHLRNSFITTGPSLSAVIDLIFPAINLTSTTTFYSNLGESFFSALSLILYDLSKLRPLSVIDLLSQDFCLAAPFEEVDFYSVSDSLDTFTWNLSLVIDGLVESKQIQANMTSSKHPKITSVVKNLTTWVLHSVFDFVNGVSFLVIREAKQACLSDENDTDDEGGDLEISSVKILSYCALSFLIGNILLLAFRSMISRRSGHHEAQRSSDDWHEPLLSDENISDDHDRFIIDIEEEEDESNPDSSGASSAKSLFHEDKIEFVIRHLFPVVVICTMALLLSSNLSLGASVDLTARVDGKEFSVPSLFEFSLWKTVAEMWNARIHALLLLVVLFSGVWPYLKLFLMLVAWFVEPSKLGTGRRGRLLFTLDALSKFSLVDTFVMILMMVSFRYHVEAGGGDASFDVYVNPQFGFYGFLLATTLSLLAGHVALFLHRKSLVSNADLFDLEEETLFQHRFAKGTNKVVLSTVLKFGLVLLLMIAATLLLVGVKEESFVFETRGLAGEVIGPNNIQEYSLLSLGGAITQSVQDPSDFGVLCLQLVYFFYTLVTPFVCLGALLYICVVPMTLSSLREVLAVAEVANAWSAIEVFCLSIVVALMQISTFAAFMVGDKCDLLNEILIKSFAEYVKDPTCFSVWAAVKWSAGYLVCGVVLNSFVSSIILRLVHVCIDERSQKAKYRRGEGIDELQLGNPRDGLSEEMRWLSSSWFASVLFVTVNLQPVVAQSDVSIDEEPTSAAEGNQEEAKHPEEDELE